MYQASHHTLDLGLNQALDQAGVIGPQLRESLRHDLKAKLLLRSGRDPVEIVGPRGSGKYTVAQAAHVAAKELLGRDDKCVYFDCEASSTGDFPLLPSALEEAAGGTLILQHYGSLPWHSQRKLMESAEASSSNALILALNRDSRQERSQGDLTTSINVKPLHERETDIWDLIDHFFTAAIEDMPQLDDEGTTCMGFSRQSKADIAEVVRKTNLTSVRKLRTVVRDIAFGTLAGGEIPLKLTSEHVRPYLEANFHQTENARGMHDAALVASQFETLLDRTLLEQLAETHDVPTSIMERQADLVREVIGYLDDGPRSYRNILTKMEDVQRAGLWLMTGARTQADFRRYFGDERFMRPTKSVAWAFYNRVFKRDM
jgi:DNA-binding NtrC family response regulator